MAKVRIVNATAQHAGLIASIVRDEDRAEFFATDGLHTAESIKRCLNLSTSAWTMYIGGDLVAVFGIAPVSLLDSVGIPWFISSRYTDKYPIAFMRTVTLYLGIMLRKYEYLESFVDARYTKAVRWLKRMGFGIHDTEPYGVSGLPFHRFSMRRT